jgi:hypothetical protein
MTLGFSIIEMSLMRPEQRGHSSTSMRKARFISSAQVYERLLSCGSSSPDTMLSPVKPSHDENPSSSGGGKCSTVAHDLTSRLCIRRQDSVVDELIDSRSRDERRDLLQQLERLEQDVRGPIPERCLQLQEDVAVVELLQPVLSDGWSEHVAAEALQSIALRRCRRADGHSCVKVEAVEVSLQGGSRRYPRRVWVGADLHHLTTCALAHRDSASN